MRSALLIAIFVTCAFWSGVQAMAADRTAPRTWNPSIAQVRKIDSLVLALPVPQGTNPASAYTRYYARVRINGRQMIYGSIVSARLESYLEANHHVPSVIAALSERIRIVVAGDLPTVADATPCFIGYMEYDIERDKLVGGPCQTLPKPSVPKPPELTPQFIKPKSP